MSKSIVVTGDFILDHHIYEGRRRHYGDEQSRGVILRTQAGGAALVHRLLEVALTPDDATAKPTWKTHLSIRAPQSASEFENIDPAQYSYAFWRPFPKKAPPAKQFWLVSEAMGFGPTRGKST